MVPIEAAADNTFHDQVISRAGDADTYAEIEFPLRTEIYVNCRNELLLLFAQGIESGERAVGGVVFESTRDPLSEIKADLHVRRELHASIHQWPMPRAIERGIEAQIPTAEFAINNRPDFPRPGVG